jgi:hypothetical protein
LNPYGFKKAFDQIAEGDGSGDQEPTRDGVEPFAKKADHLAVQF